MRVTVTRVYFEMRAPSELRAARAPADAPSVSQEARDPALWRHLYEETGKDHHWVDRLAWSDEAITQSLAERDAELWTARTRGGAIAGWFQLDRHPDGSVEVGYFGLLPSFISRGLGGWLLTHAALRAWSLDPARVWLHSCNLDHPAAIPNYLARGFRATRWETYETTLAPGERAPFPLDAAALARGS